MTMQFSKTTPVKTTTYTAEWVSRAYTKMSPKFRAIRAKSRNPMNSCFKCRHRFEDGETMGLACFGGKGNKSLCQTCSDELLSQEKTK